MVEIISLIVAFLASTFEAKMAYPYLPDFTLTVLLFLFLRTEIGWAMFMALIIGILRDGVDPSHIWISPLIFVTYAFVARWMKMFVNTNVSLIVFIYATLLTFAYRAVLYYGFDASPAWYYIAASAIMTGLLVTILASVFKK